MHDVIIIGAGPVGLGAAAMVADLGLKALVLEQAPLEQLQEPREDGREIALTHRGVALLQAFGHWKHIPADQTWPLRAARVFNGGSARTLDFFSGDAGASGVDRLGTLVPNHLLRRAAWLAAQERGERVQLRAQAQVRQLALGSTSASVGLASGERFEARLVIAADSRFSATRRLAGIGADQLDFGRSVILCRMQVEREHQHTALECFHHGHTMAWLPLQPGVCSLVLTLNGAQAQELLRATDQDFLAWVQQHSQGRLGQLSLAGPRHHYPLVASYAHRFAAQRLVLAGDAAVGMHPVTAHGYNFGLYGLETLRQQLKARAVTNGSWDPGAPGPLQAYAREHRQATRTIYLGTNAVVGLFTNERPLARLLRDSVLQGASRLPPLRAWINAQLTGAQR
ncbi:5-demethoxyubiquinol-8 5-hydroxylase UbiM [Roseateles sp. BYS180W]|uniref:5-demethoxyubiquinol-8 5-hydroxylase UbiM n=1 Tax=Roseateles rivi TaxID=3299028 RepID=A0ABW7FY98_9BURK